MEKYGKEESNSITTQKTLLLQFVNESEDLRIYDKYIDDGFSGTNFNRPGFQRLLQDMHSGKINCVLTKDLSRLRQELYRSRKLYRANISIV